MLLQHKKDREQKKKKKKPSLSAPKPRFYRKYFEKYRLNAEINELKYWIYLACANAKSL